MSNKNKSKVDELFISLPLERECLSGLLKFPSKFQNVIGYLQDIHFQHPRHRNIFSLARQSYEKNETLTAATLIQKLINIKIGDVDGISISDYIDDLYTSRINEAGVEVGVKQLVKNSCEKSIYEKLSGSANFLLKNRNLPLDVMINELDKQWHSKDVEFFSDLTPVKLFNDLDTTLDEINHDYANGKCGLLGPFDTLNKLYGSLHRPGQMTVICSESGGGKSSLGLYYNMWMCIKYNIPVLHCDAGEMSRKQLIVRALSSLTEGKVSYYAIESGKYKTNKESYRLVEEAKKKANNLPIYFENTAGLTPLETHGLFRKYAFNVIGRGNPFIIHYDYLKPFDSADSNDPEWKVLRDFANNTKEFLEEELPWVSFWTSIQANAGGTATNRRSSDIDDSSNAIGVSKAVKNSAALFFILRVKATDELEEHGLEYGSHCLINVKKRFLGEQAQRALSKVLIKKSKDDKGKLYDNVVYLKTDSFHYQDCGDTYQMAQELNNKIDIDDKKEDDDARL